MTVTDMSGEPVASSLLDAVTSRIETLGEQGVTPTLATVLMSDDTADRRFVALKHEACDAVGIETLDRCVPPDGSTMALSETIASLSDDPAVDAVFVQAPLPERVDDPVVRRRLDPVKDVDCFHPENLGRLVAGNPRFVPATTVAVCRLLDHYDVSVAGSDVVVVGRSTAIGTPLANRLLWDDDPGNATVTVCHSHTEDLAAYTRRADVLVTACGVPGLVDESMLREGVVVVDVSANRRVEGGEPVVTGDVDADSARERASAMTPVPGGVGPVTVAALLSNVVRAAERRRDEDVDSQASE